MSSLALLIFIYPNTTMADVACGSVYSPALPWSEAIGGNEPEAVTNCAEPFGTPLPWRDDMVVKVEGVSLSPGVNFVVPDNGADNYEVRLPAQFGMVEVGWFLHTPRGYEFQHTSPSRPESADIERLAADFFAPDIDTAHYIAAVIAGELAIQGEADQLLFDFYEYIDREYVPVLPTLPVGTYTVVVMHSYLLPVKAQPNILQWLFPTAYAAMPLADEVYTMTFSLVPEMVVAEKPSVLFLPGIMGSHLFEESPECGLGSVQQRWLAFLDCDHERLGMNAEGQSAYPLYTKPGEDGVFVSAPLLPLYSSFISELEDWQQDGEIADYTLVPYDWRLRLGEVLKTRYDAASGHVIYDEDTTLTESYLYKSLEDLVAVGGPVTIVAHSNGGLLAKYFIHALEEANDPLLAKVENLILVGVPQLGTPDAVDGILHGSKIPFVMGAPLSRELVNTMPFIYHLLPGTGYFNSVQTPVVSFASGSLTDGWSEQFGPAIYNRDDLHTFMVRESGRTDPDADDIQTPEVVEQAFLDYAKEAEVFQTSFDPPLGMKVYQVAGTGVVTPSGIEYFTDQECVRWSRFFCEQYADKIGYRITSVIDGDDTVVTASALAQSESDGVERWWLDLKSINTDEFIARVHKNIFEVQEVISLIGNTVFGHPNEFYQFLGQDSPEFINEDRLVLQLHSPLDLMVRLEGGEIVGSSSLSVRNVIYRRYGEVQTLSIPEDETNLIVQLVGTGSGSFTLDIERYRGNDRKQRETYSAIPSSTSTVVQLALPEVTAAYYELQIDYEGDGVVDVTQVRGEIEQVAQLGTRSKTDSRPAQFQRPEPSRLLGEVVLTRLEVDPRQIEIVTLAAEVVRLLTLLVEYNKNK